MEGELHHHSVKYVGWARHGVFNQCDRSCCLLRAQSRKPQLPQPYGVGLHPVARSNRRAHRTGDSTPIWRIKKEQWTNCRRCSNRLSPIVNLWLYSGILLHRGNADSRARNSRGAIPHCWGAERWATVQAYNNQPVSALIAATLLCRSAGT